MKPIATCGSVTGHPYSQTTTDPWNGSPWRDRKLVVELTAFYDETKAGNIACLPQVSGATWDQRSDFRS